MTRAYSGNEPSISFEVSTASPSAKRIFCGDTAISTMSAASSSRRFSSLMVLRGTITPGMPCAPFGAGVIGEREAVAVGGDGAQHSGRRRRTVWKKMPFR